jgi:Na+-transporting NADH:ubiquinone oxidoreductase subunit C
VKARLLMIVFVLVLGSILTASLIAVDYYTTPMIARNEDARLMSGILQALGIPHGEGVLDEGSLEDIFAAQVKPSEAGGRTYYRADDGSIAFAFEGAGLWGPITGIIAVQGDLASLKGVTIIRQEETPGLGGRITEDWFLDQFRDRPFRPRLKAVAPGKSSGETDIDAVTGATMTSNAFVEIINTELEEFLPLIGGKQT